MCLYGMHHHMHYPDHLRIITVCLTWQSGFISIDSAPLQKSYMTAMEIWLLERAEPLYKIYPWKALLRAGSRGCAETDYGQNLMRKMMMSYDADPKEYARLAGFGYRMLAEAIKADLPYRISCPALLICGEKDRAGSAKSYNKKWHQREGIPLKWIKNAGHNSNTDQPDEVNRLIEKFIGEVDGKNLAKSKKTILYEA
jgi:pimeloyl-ACP methyl ester carboxylesterase